MKSLIMLPLSIILSAVSVSAQQRPPNDAPGESHAALGRFVGEWEVTGRLWRSSDSIIPPIEGRLTLSAKMVMGGRFLVESMTSQPPTRPFESVRILGYDNLTRHYEGAIYDSQGTNIIRPVGEINAAGQVVLNYSYTDLGTATSVAVRTVRKLISENEWIETAYETQSGSERRVRELHARRKQ